MKKWSLGICKPRGEANTKLDIIIYRLKTRTRLTWFRINPAVDFCEHGHEILVFVTADFFDQLAYYQFLNTNISMYLKHHNDFFYVFSTVHHSIELFHLPTLMHSSLFINNTYVTLLSSTCFEH